MTMLTGVLVVLVLLLAPYIHPWVTQRSQIEANDEKVRELRDEVERLTAQRRRWDDPAYVRAQARDRLRRVMPGETRYMVFDDASAAESSPGPRTAVALPEKGRSTGEGPWYERVWSSVQIAGDPTTEQARSAPVLAR
jgi:cell division protein FtsB